MGRTTRGATYFDTLIGLFLSLMLMSTIIYFLSTAYGSNNKTNSVNLSSAAAQAALDTVADHVRNAQSVDGSAVSDAQDDEITYEAGLGVTVRYHLSGTTLYRHPSDGSDTAVLENVTSLTFSYLLTGKYNYHTFTTPADPTALTSDELKTIAIVNLTCTAIVDGISRQFHTSIRLRNSPLKTSL